MKVEIILQVNLQCHYSQLVWREYGPDDLTPYMYHVATQQLIGQVKEKGRIRGKFSIANCWICSVKTSLKKFAYAVL